MEKPMALRVVTIDKKAKTVTLVLDLDDPRTSSSGKTKVIASTRGGFDSGVLFQGKNVVVNVNAYFKP
jgi:hypothetical protein